MREVLGASGAADGRSQAAQSLCKKNLSTSAAGIGRGAPPKILFLLKPSLTVTKQILD